MVADGLPGQSAPDAEMKVANSEATLKSDMEGLEIAADAACQHLAGDGAHRHVDLAQERGVDLLTFEHAASQPGVQPELQPLAGEAVGLQRAPAEALRPGFPSLAHRAERVQMVGRRHGAVARVAPPNSKPASSWCVGPVAASVEA